ncbi:MAG: hypothetical protein WC052_01550 [Patescibacteria group bacterium]|jgi:folate-dependent phosphoribosylglycinamide formyltransferase PurN
MEGGILHGLVELVCAVATNTKDALGLIDKLTALGMTEGDNLLVVPYKVSEAEHWGRVLLELSRQFAVDHVGLYGCIPTVPESCVRALVAEGIRGTNQHPAHPKAFGGPGMFGKRVVASQIAFARLVLPRDFVAMSVCQDLDPFVDEGRVLHFEECPILPADDVDSLQARLLPTEHCVQIEALRRAAQGELLPVDCPSPVRAGEERRLNWAKEIGFMLYPEGRPYKECLARMIERRR